MKVPELRKLTRKKVEKGHYIYAGYHIKREVWNPKSRMKFTVWTIEDVPEKRMKNSLLKVKIQRHRFSTLNKAIMHIEGGRQELWFMAHVIENENVERLSQRSGNDK